MLSLFFDVNEGKSRYFKNKIMYGMCKPNYYAWNRPNKNHNVKLPNFTFTFGVHVYYCGQQFQHFQQQSYFGHRSSVSSNAKGTDSFKNVKVVDKEYWFTHRLILTEPRWRSQLGSLCFQVYPLSIVLISQSTDLVTAIFRRTSSWSGTTKFSVLQNYPWCTSVMKWT